MLKFERSLRYPSEAGRCHMIPEDMNTLAGPGLVADQLHLLRTCCFGGSIGSELRSREIRSCCGTVIECLCG